MTKKQKLLNALKVLEMPFKDKEEFVNILTENSSNDNSGDSSGKKSYFKFYNLINRYTESNVEEIDTLLSDPYVVDISYVRDNYTTINKHATNYDTLKGLLDQGSSFITVKAFACKQGLSTEDLPDDIKNNIQEITEEEYIDILDLYA